MPGILSRAKELLVDVPKHGKLAYCLLRDERIPRAPKVMLLGAMGLVLSPIDFPAWIPVVGELDMLALTVLAVKTFIEACPADIRREHEAALEAKTSVWDRDVRDTAGAARHGLGLFVDRARSRFRRGEDLESVSEVV